MGAVREPGLGQRCGLVAAGDRPRMDEQPRPSREHDGSGHEGHRNRDGRGHARPGRRIHLRRGFRYPRRRPERQCGTSEANSRDEPRKTGGMPEPFVLEGDDLVRAVGTSHYQDALLALTGRQGDEEVRVDKLAVFVPEPDNPHDPNAIAVHVDGHLVGYLAREENVRWRDVLTANPPIAAEAMLAGRGGTTGIGVFLRLPTPTEARAQIALWQRRREAR